MPGTTTVGPGLRSPRDAPAQAPQPPLDCDTPIARAWAVALWAVAGLWLIGLVVPAAADAIQQLDDRVWEAALSAQHPVLVALADLLDVFGGTLATTAAVVGVAALLAWRRRGPGVVVWLVTMTVSQGLNLVTKALYERARPPLGLTDEHSFSFVSGHSLIAAAAAITLVLVWVPAGNRRRNLLIVAAAYALLMAASRVYLRAHWLSDAWTGVVIGAACAVTVALVASWWSARRSRSRSAG